MNIKTISFEIIGIIEIEVGYYSSFIMKPPPANSLPDFGDDVDELVV